MKLFHFILETRKTAKQKWSAHEITTAQGHEHMHETQIFLTVSKTNKYKKKKSQVLQNLLQVVACVWDVFLPIPGLTEMGM